MPLKSEKGEEDTITFHPVQVGDSESVLISGLLAWPGWPFPLSPVRTKEVKCEHVSLSSSPGARSLLPLREPRGALVQTLPRPLNLSPLKAQELHSLIRFPKRQTE